jgi:sigma-B regulation protein RsbU (phosphoserine phosphatase)
MSELELKTLLERKELELNALLEITQSINNNVPEDFALYKNFQLYAALKSQHQEVSFVCVG